MTPSKNSMVAKIMVVTPEIAKKWLSSDYLNRALREIKVRRFAALMIGLRWRLNNQGIGIGRKGELIDGQHRLTAVVVANIPVKMLVCVYQDDHAADQARTSVDIGTLRTRSDFVKMDGIPNSRVYSAAFTMILEQLNIDASFYGNMQDFRPHFPGLQSICPKLAGTGGNVTSVCAAAGLLHRWYPTEVNAFVDLYSTGDGLSCKSPIFLLRELNRRAKTKKADRIAVFRKAIRAIEGYVRSETMNRLIDLPEIATRYLRYCSEQDQRDSEARLQKNRAV